MALMGINAATTEQGAIKAATAVYHPTLDMADAVKGALETRIRQFRTPPGWTQPIPPPLPFGFDVMNLIMSEYYSQTAGTPGVAGAAPAVAPPAAVAPPPAAPAPVNNQRRRPQRRRPTQIRRGPTAPQPTAPQPPPPPQPQPNPGNMGSFSYPPSQNAWPLQQPVRSQWPSPPQSQWRQPQRSQWSQQQQQSQWRQSQSQWPTSQQWQPQRQQQQWSQPPRRQPEPTPQYSPQGTTGQFINGWEQNYFGGQTQRPVPPPPPSPSSVPDFTPLASSMPGWINPFYNPNSNPSAWK